MSDETKTAAPSRIVVVTGASSGLGAQIAREVVGRKLATTIVLIARRDDRLKELAEELEKGSEGLVAVVLPADLSDPADVSWAAEQIVSHFGGVDVLVNNAGFGLPTLFADAPVDDVERQIAVNFTAPIVFTRRLVDSLIERRGTIINVGSAITCVANSALGAYGATKAGLAYWNDALRRELSKDGVKVCLVEPGPMATEFSKAFRSLASDESQVHPVVDAPSAWMTADVRDVANRVVDLMVRPRRRLSVLRRVVWPFRLAGALVWMFPALGDWAVSRVLHVERSESSSRREVR